MYYKGDPDTTNQNQIKIVRITDTAFTGIIKGSHHNTDQSLYEHFLVVHKTTFLDNLSQIKVASDQWVTAMFQP